MLLAGMRTAIKGASGKSIGVASSIEDMTGSLPARYSRFSWNARVAWVKLPAPVSPLQPLVASMGSRVLRSDAHDHQLRSLAC